MRVQLITVPYRYDKPEEGLGAGPGALIREGVAEKLAAVGHDVDGPIEARLDPEEREEGRTAVNIGRLGAHTAALVAAARRRGAGAFVLAGDDTASIGVVAGLQQVDGTGAPIGIVWLDAHGDFNTPETSFSGILAGMPVAILAGLAGPLWRGAAGLAAPIPTDRIVLAGVRQLDEQEVKLLRSTDVRVISTKELAGGRAFPAALERLTRTCSLLSLHVDLDVLDPALVPSASTPAQHGLEIAEAAAAMATVLRTGQVAAVCISSLNPGGGARGKRSVATALRLIEEALGAWERCPSPPAAAD